ncbi:sugar phosphate nucleotidyltransferase [Geofilum rubicundum]|uniref:Nucleotidyl transferase n=1 Tax=Geofilum rubicundum JCM 15548 TaxID=1236989 RepID=A0A0E9M0G6_9BACT|nr:sugar phosphate nucleotidyltransferase [Geofilum rubicundum]GAO31327.1 nucleotidyl transferase [Geofilum rubicundum JCM 15548]
MSLNAMIFAAGIGSRLKPYTDTCPKALVKIADHPMLEMALQKLERLQVRRVVVNVHHHAQQVKDFLRDYQSDHMEICISDESDQLLDTGGGLIHAAPLFEKGSDILIYNVDVLTNAPLKALVQYHQAGIQLVTLMIQKRKASRYLLFDQDLQLCGWRNPKTQEELWVDDPEPNALSYGFNGVQVISYQLLTLINNKKSSFPIIPEYLQLAQSQAIKGWIQSSGSEWFDIGTPDKLDNASKLFLTCTSQKRQTFF